MRIIYTKTGKFAFDPVNGPVQECTKHSYANLPKEHAQMLIDAKWARKYEEFKQPWLLPDWNGDADDAKDILDEYSNKKYGVGVDKRRTVKTIIRSLKKMRADRKND